MARAEVEKLCQSRKIIQDAPRVLYKFRETSGPENSGSPVRLDSTQNDTTADISAPQLSYDIDKKDSSIQRIAESAFVQDANTEHYQAVQDWISQCAKEVQLPQNFCGGVLIMRLCRYLIPLESQSDDLFSSIHDLAAAYDFSFLALGHADDETDLTRERNGVPTRWITHPNTRAVDGINLLLAGLTSAQNTLINWPADTPFQPNKERLLSELLRALREGSFPILLDRAGFGHLPSDDGAAKVSALQLNQDSLKRIAQYSRHRAQTYFVRAFRIGVLASGYEKIDPTLEVVLDHLFELFGSIGAASDDLNDALLDLSAGVHSVVSVMAHLCVDEDPALRPPNRKAVEKERLTEQRKRLAAFWGANETTLDRGEVLEFFREIELRSALREHYKGKCIEFSRTMYEAVVNYGLPIELISDLVSHVTQDPNFAIPHQYMNVLRSMKDEQAVAFAICQIGEYIADYLLDQFWPDH